MGISLAFPYWDAAVYVRAVRCLCYTAVNATEKHPVRQIDLGV